MPYVAPAPLSFIGRALVQGNIGLKPGTAIATFDGSGRYGNHTNGTSHAAIYLGQDANGIEVIDQWNIRQHHQIVGRHQPQRRRLRFGNPQAEPVNQGSRYYVVE